MKFKAATLVFAVFLSGVFVGGLAVHVFGDRIWSTRASSSSSMPSREELLQELSQQLNLTADQRTEVRAIMDQTLADWHQIYLTVNPQLEEARQRGRQRIRGVLTPEQLPQFDVFIHNLDERLAKAEHQTKEQQAK
jgi:Spy/CpxP family protein refolding chaperone